MHITPLEIKSFFSLGLIGIIQSKNRTDKTELGKTGVTDTNFQGLPVNKQSLNQDLLPPILVLSPLDNPVSHPKLLSSPQEHEPSYF